MEIKVKLMVGAKRKSSVGGMWGRYLSLWCLSSGGWGTNVAGLIQKSPFVSLFDETPVFYGSQVGNVVNQAPTPSIAESEEL